MGRMALHHHRATRGEGGCGVAARDREGEREVGRAEHGDRTDRLVDAAQVAARQRLALRQCLVDGGVQPVALAHIACEQAKLADGAAPLALQPPARPARSEEHTSALQSIMRRSYSVSCLKKKKYKNL